VRPLGLLLVDVPPEHKASAPRAAVSASQYEQTTSRAELRRQGCAAGRRNVGGLTILDFGKPAWNGHSYGTILFSERFVSNKGITRALYAFAVSHVRCLPRGSERRIVLARGTSNYGIVVPSPYDAGRAWARETNRLGRLFAAHPNLAEHVTSAAADDIDAHQWAELARSGLRTYHRPLWFAGVITQHRARCGCSLEPHDARRALQRALALHVGSAAPAVPATLTNIVY
jgi:hypothetical protein